MKTRYRKKNRYSENLGTGWILVLLYGIFAIIRGEGAEHHVRERGNPFYGVRAVNRTFTGAGRGLGWYYAGDDIWGPVDDREDWGVIRIFVLGLVIVREVGMHAPWAAALQPEVRQRETCLVFLQ